MYSGLDLSSPIILPDTGTLFKTAAYPTDLTLASRKSGSSTHKRRTKHSSSFLLCFVES